MLQKKYLNGVEIQSVDLKKLNEVLREKALTIKEEHPEISRIFLFGSLSRGDFTASSDIDIAVIMLDTDKNFITRQDDFIEYFVSLPLDVNLAVYTEEEVSKMESAHNPFIEEIQKGSDLLS